MRRATLRTFNTSRPFVFQVDTSLLSSPSGLIFGIESRSSNANYSVITDDGFFESGITGGTTITFTEEGIRTITLYGYMPSIILGLGEYSASGLIKVLEWGDNKWESFNNMFPNCVNLNFLGNDSPILSEENDVRGMFSGLNVPSQLENWDFSLLETMEQMFSYSLPISANLSNIDTSNVKNMRRTFLGSQANPNILSWDIRNVETMEGMFKDSNFNNSIGFWKPESLKDNGGKEMFSNSNMSSTNYTNTLVNWITHIRQNSSFNVTDFTGQTGMTFDNSLTYFLNPFFPTAASARDWVDMNQGYWNIAGDTRIN